MLAVNVWQILTKDWSSQANNHIPWDETCTFLGRHICVLSLPTTRIHRNLPLVLASKQHICCDVCDKKSECIVVLPPCVMVFFVSSNWLTSENTGFTKLFKSRSISGAGCGGSQQSCAPNSCFGNVEGLRKHFWSRFRVQGQFAKSLGRTWCILHPSGTFVHNHALIKV